MYAHRGWVAFRVTTAHGKPCRVNVMYFRFITPTHAHSSSWLDHRAQSAPVGLLYMFQLPACSAYRPRGEAPRPQLPAFIACPPLGGDWKRELDVSIRENVSCIDFH